MCSFHVFCVLVLYGGGGTFFEDESDGRRDDETDTSTYHPYDVDMYSDEQRYHSDISTHESFAEPPPSYSYPKYERRQRHPVNKRKVATHAVPTNTEEDTASVALEVGLAAFQVLTQISAAVAQNLLRFASKSLYSCTEVMYVAKYYA